MERPDFQYHPCRCGKKLRMDISKITTPRDVIATCLSCGNKHRVTLNPPVKAKPNREYEKFIKEVAEDIGQLLKKVKVHFQPLKKTKGTGKS
jgi:hypothetical protein